MDFPLTGPTFTNIVTHGIEIVFGATSCAQAGL